MWKLAAAWTAKALMTQEETKQKKKQEENEQQYPHF
jgi:hypothetical protein